jgi:hypothetical protein|tara:strand:+ start:433 stop:630 length:198 start_codon:yes stop_codon:yes gene_type:complete
MAKFSRFDPRNKKRGRNKNNYLEKDFRIKNVDLDKKNYVHSPKNMVEYNYNEGETNEQSKQGNTN